MTSSVLLLHGGGLGPWMWRSLESALAPDFATAAPLLPGHSGVDGETFTFDRALAEVVEVIERDGDPVHVVGLSLGGQLALLLAASRPDLVDRLIVTGANTQGLPGLRFIRPTMRATLPLKNIGVIQRATIKRLAIPEQDAPDYLASAAATTVDSVTAVFEQSGRFRLPAGLGTYDGPALVMSGEKEPKLMHRSVAEVAEALPNATAAIVPGASHAWPLENAPLFAVTVRAWLTDAPLNLSDGAPRGLWARN